MTDFPIVAKTDLDEGQRILWDELTLGPRGAMTGGPDAERLPGLFNAWLQFPEFGTLMLRLSDAIRTRPDLSGKLRELVMLTTSAELGSDAEFAAHAPLARNEGLADAVIEALRTRGAPPFIDMVEQTVHAAVTELLRHGSLSRNTQDSMVEMIGHRGLMVLLATVTLYSVIAKTSNLVRA